ncbi:unnamed protein product [Phaedon cochleariae]|uniref:Carboxylic ester hydrolase n=1 Tax=Phaedon cochleariae TaxID=80249 RepID=A0A9P0GQH3_PHACE|nr:unnamed protein product [Phaedon cochleariae]
MFPFRNTLLLRCNMTHFSLATAILLYNLVGVFATDTQNNGDPIVTISDGIIRGRSLQSQKNSQFYAFQQIPYASPPVGHLRFRSPVPPQKWNHTWNATENTKICYQLERNDSRETEDCLYLNVYTPVLGPTENPLAVYVFLHGGKFIFNDGTYESFGPEFLMDYGIILVTLNYRLGAFGFLSTDDSTIPGNMGLEDQLQALLWVRENIHAFGGDPNKITLGGQSSGAASVGHHLLSPQSTGLFRSAIMQSGSPLCSKMFQKHPKYYANKLVSLLQDTAPPYISSLHVLQVLQNASAEDIKKHSDIAIPTELRNSVGNEDNRVWAPVIDGSFVIGAMHENLKHGKFSAIPTLIGINSEEQIHFDSKELWSKTGYFDSSPSYLINGNLNIENEYKLIAGLEIKSIYTNGSFEKDFGSFVRFMSDAKYTTAVIRHADLQKKYSTLFFYQFSYHGLFNNNNASVEGAERVGHSEENNFLFRMRSNRDLENFPKSDLDAQARLLEIWTNFIKFSNPSPTGMNWPQVEPGLFSYVNINTTLSIKQDPKDYQKWRSVYDKYADQYQETY